MSSPLPDGFRVRLVDDAIVLGEGTVLVGGSPLTALRIAKGRPRFRAGCDLVATDPASSRLAERLLATNLALPDLSTTAPPIATDLTVVIPVRDRPEQLDHCLASLEGLTCLVVDDASVDPDAIAGVACRHKAILVSLTENVGPAAARNAGLTHVATPYVAFVDSDVEVRSVDLLALARHFVDPSVAVVGPRVVGKTRQPRPRWFERYETRDSSLTLGTQSGAVRPGAAVAWLPSACVVGRTSALRDGFDPHMRVGEDVDLVWRLADGGWRIRYDAAVQADHETRPTVRGWLGRKAFYGSGSAALAARHGDRVAPAALSPTYALAAAAVLLRHRLAVPLALVAVARGHRSVARALPTEPSAVRASVSVATRGFGWAVRQESALALRHWWPLTLVGFLLSWRVRRAVTAALLVDLALTLRETPDLPVRDLPAHFAARRLDDLSYGAGLWWGAFRHRTLAPLAPRWITRTSPRPW